jgi:hypothetical protein
MNKARPHEESFNEKLNRLKKELKQELRKKERTKSRLKQRKQTKSRKPRITVEFVGLPKVNPRKPKMLD